MKRNRKNDLKCIKQPEVIEDVFEIDYNILNLNDIIIQRLNQEKNILVPQLKEDCKKLNDKLKTRLTRVEQLYVQDEIKKNERMINEIESENRIREYRNSSVSLINEYQKYRLKYNIVNLDQTDKKCGVLDYESSVRISIIEKFLEIAEKYIKINIYRIVNSHESFCDNCGFILSKIYPNDNGIIQCPECFLESVAVVLSRGSKENLKTPNNHGDDDSIDNFLKALNHFQGLQKSLPKELLDELRFYFKDQMKIDCDEIMKLSHNRNGTKNGTNRTMITTALSHIRKTEYYKNYNLIGHLLWGWILPDVSKYRDKIIDHYNKTQKVFCRIPPEERCRVSSLGTQYRLWRHLQLVGYPCTMNQFKIAEDPNSLIIHNELWRKMCEGCNDPEIYYID